MNSTPAEHSFFRWLRSLDLQRGPDRWIGGVASGLATRTRLDPILVRGIILLVVLFTGVGLFLYGLAWALLPGPTGRIHVQEVGRGNWTLGFSGALLLVILGAADWFGPRFWYRGDFDFGGLVLIGVVALGVWFFVARSRNRREAEAGDDGAPAAQSAPDAADAAPLAAPSAGTTSSAPHRFQTPPPPKRSRPAPAPRPPRPAPAPRPRHRRLSGATTAIVLGLAVLAGAGVLAADFFTSGAGSFTPWAWTVAFAVALSVLGAGLVVAALSKRSGGALTGWAVLLLIPTLIAGLFAGALGGPGYGPRGGFFSDTARHDDGVYAFSRSRTDLTHLSTIEEDTHVPFNTAFSRATVIVPADIPVYLDGAAPFMSVEVESADGVELLEISGVTTPQHHLLTGVTEGPSLTLDVNGAFSRVDIIVDADGEDLVGSDDFPWGETESTEQHIQPLEPMEAIK